MDEDRLDYLLKEAEVGLHDHASMHDGCKALLQAMKGIVEYMQDFKKSQAHQQSRERRREERFKNHYDGVQEDAELPGQGSEDYELARKFGERILHGIVPEDDKHPEGQKVVEQPKNRIENTCGSAFKITEKMNEIGKIAECLAEKAFVDYPYRYSGPIRVRGQLSCGAEYLVVVRLE